MSKIQRHDPIEVYPIYHARVRGDDRGGFALLTESKGRGEDHPGFTRGKIIAGLFRIDDPGFHGLQPVRRPSITPETHTG